jgi:glycerol-3-phosphate cytidylyltransferase-like family protein
LKIDAPQLLFTGVLGSEVSFSKGIKNKILKAEFEARKNSLTWGSPEILIDDIRQLFLDIESKYGGKEEGVVMKYNDRLLKWQQEYQLDQEARFNIKMKYKEDDWDSENQYWKNVTGAAEGIARTIVVKSRKLPEILEELALIMKKIPLNFEHSKKTQSIIKDDIQLTTKSLLIKQMRGNNNALILGKFRVLSDDGHAKMIRRAQKLYDNVVICLVTSKDTKNTKDLREEMIRKTFPGVEIVHAQTGNLISILGKSPVNINVIYAGSDRVKSYQEQLKNTLGTTVREMPRTDDDISASKIIANIGDEEFFKKNTPKAIHDMYNKIKEKYNEI